MKKFILLVICITNFTLLFAETNSPIVKKDGKNYYEYTVKQGDGLFSITRKFNVKQSDLHDANPGLTTNIKAGEKILIPIKTEISENSIQATTTHIVEAKQTLFSISKIYNIPVEKLIELNPNAKNGIKIGETLIISTDQNTNPTENNIISKEIQPEPINSNDQTHVVKKKETLFSISKTYNIAIHDLIAMNPELKDGLKAGTTIIIKKGENQNSQEQKTPETIEIKKKDDTTIENQSKINTPVEKEEIIKNDDPIISSNITIVDDTTDQIEYVEEVTYINSNDSLTPTIVYLLPLVAENINEEKNIIRFVEFYRGAILALNDAKKNGLSANIYTYNLPKSTQKIDSVLQLLNDKKIDIVIGPAYSEQLNQVLTYTKERDITTIVPFSNKIDTTLYFPKLIQFNPPQDSLFNTIINNTLIKNNSQFILTRFEKCKNKGNEFVNNLAHLLAANNKEYKEITITPQNIKPLIKNLSTESTILVLGSSRVNDVAPVIDSLSNYQLPYLKVWGFEEWGANIIKKHPKTLYYSLFYPQETKEYQENYNNWFGIKKQNVNLHYDLLGYDLTLLALTNVYPENTEDLYNFDYLQSKPNLEFDKNRWLNMAYYLFYWDKSTLKEIK